MWTLTVEVSFYALLPLLGALALRARGGRVLMPLALLAAGVAWNWWLAGMERVPLPLAKVLPAMAPYFAVGMLAAVALQAWTPGRRAAAWLLAGGAVAVAGDLVWQAAAAGDGTSDLWARILRDLPAALGFAAIVAVAAAGRAPRLLAWRPLAAVGTVSYGLYLWHVPLLVWGRAHALLPMNAAGATLVALPVSLAVAAASWRCLERPALRWARRSDERVRPRRPRRREPSPALRAAPARPASASSRSAGRSPAA
jgi:peptidoglycan/LPS O-acetylase OafA/YrhL